MSAIESKPQPERKTKLSELSFSELRSLEKFYKECLFEQKNNLSKIPFYQRIHEEHSGNVEKVISSLQGRLDNIERAMFAKISKIDFDKFL